MNKQLQEIIKRAYDLHVHIGPEVIPRKYDARSLAAAETGKLAGCVLKNHFFPTSAMFSADDVSGLECYGSIVLNNAVGGMNPEAVFAASLVARTPLVVWLPTINSAQFLRTNRYEVAPEWVTDKSLKLKSAEETSVVAVTKNGKLLPQTKRVIEMTAQVNGVLATGHIAASESMLVAAYARALDVTVIVTHPIYQHIDMSVESQKQLATLGCYLEQPYSMYSMDSISIERIADQIRAVGSDSVILSSDVGQTFSPSPSTALFMYAELLVKADIPLQWIETMLVTNPRKILGLEKDR